MPVSLEDCLVIGISSRALFDLRRENEIFERDGLQAYSDYQIAHEDELLEPGSGFSLVKALLRLNALSGKHMVEVIIMSRNSADTSLRVFSSIEHYGLDITRAVLSGDAAFRDKDGTELYPGNDRFVFDLEKKQLITGEAADAAGGGVPAQVARPQIIIPKGSRNVFVIPKSVSGDSEEK